MEYRMLGWSGCRVSELCLGTMQFGWTVDEVTAHGVLDLFVESGGNFLDTANIYAHGASEEIIGCWLHARQNRREIVLATKVGLEMWNGPNGKGLSRGHILRAVADSLHRLQTDYIDVLYAHRPWYDGDPAETLAAFDDLVHSGKVRYVGCSNYPAWLLVKSLWISDVKKLARFACVQPKYNLVHRAEFEREVLPVCQDQQLGVVAYSPQAAGVLTGKYRWGGPAATGPRANTVKAYLNERSFRAIDELDRLAEANGKTVAQVALGWVLTRPAVTCALIGVNAPAQLEESLGAVGLRLDDDQMARLDALTAWEGP